MDEREKIENVKRSLAGWNDGDLDQALAGVSEDFEWDLRRSDIPCSLKR